MTSPKTGFVMRGFLPGVGILTVSRGLGPITDEEIVFPPTARAKEGGGGPRIVTRKRRRPKIVTIKGIAKKKEC